MALPELKRQQPEQELKPAMNPLLQGIMNLKGGGLEGLLGNDPVIQNLIKAGGFFEEQVNDPLNYNLAAKGLTVSKMALTPFMIARRKEIQQTLKTFDDDPILRGNEAVRTKLKKELDQINKTEVEELRVDKQLDGFLNKPDTFGRTADATTKTGRTAIKQTEVPTVFTKEMDDFATQIRRQEAAGADPTSLFEEVPQEMVEDLLRELSRNKFK